MSCQCEMEGKKCGEHKGSHECCDMHMMLLELADEAWMEVLKDKIKAEILATNGEQMDKVAKLVAEANMGKWTHMIKGRSKCEEFKNSLNELMSASCKG